MKKENRDEILKPGTVFEKYTIEKQLGRGGMGAVYLVRHNVLDSFFALKVLFPDIASKNKQFVKRFIREAKLACKIKHPNLITVHDAGCNPDNGMYYIVMDYVAGGSVRELLKRMYRLPPERALQIITQVTAALVAAYSHHMVHRDIKPDNIMFAADGTVKLADLGIAKSMDERDTMLTMASAVFGTPAYMSPEQAKDSHRVDCRADIYSLGVVFYEMLSGQRPYRGDSTIQILSQVVAEGNIPDIRRLRPEIPPELAMLIAEMTEKKLSERIPNPIVLLERLNAIHLPSAAEQSSEETDGANPELTLPTVVRPVKTPPEKAAADSGGGAQVSESAGESRFSKTRKITLPLPPESPPPQGEGGSAPAGGVILSESKIPSAWKRWLPELRQKEGRPEPIAKAETSRGEAGKKRILRLAIAGLMFVVILCFALFLLQSRGGKTKTVSASAPPGNSARSGGAAAEFEQKERAPAVVSASVPAEENSDPLGRGRIVLLADDSEFAQSIRKDLTQRFGAEQMSFQQAERMGGFQEKLERIVAAAPAAVVLCLSGKYAGDRISKASFENIIRRHADRFREQGIPIVFLLAPEQDGERRQHFFNEVTRELCNLRSIPVLSAEELSKDKLAELIREIRRK